ncbi:MAG: ABC transporter ATP-binding protein [bacterium]|nr:MAG: ABC transporter ATP-binding protein [bacterium]
MISPRIVQKAIDLLQHSFQMTQIRNYALMIIAVAFAQGFFLFLMRRTIIVASREIENDLRNDLFWKLEELSSSFYNQMPTGDIMSRATNDMNAVRSVLGPGIAYSVNTIMAFLFVIPMMITISPLLTAIALIPFPIMAVIVNRFGKAINKRYEKIQAQLAAISTFVQENLSGIAIIRAFVREKHQMEKFYELNEDYLHKNLSFARVYAAFHPVLMLIIGFAVVLVLLGGGKLVIDKTISIGELTAFMLYLGMLVWPSIALGWVVGLYQQGTASMKRIRHILDADPDIVDGQISLFPDQPEGKIEYKNLNFSYEETPILENINLTIHPQATLGILGQTGSGKTTLVRLIPHLYPLSTGQLFIDERDINEYQLSALRRQIGYVTQDTFLFSDTIHNNIAFATPDASREEVISAAKIAAIHTEILEFPEGYDSYLGERGINLSGGQKQRVSIARAILANPKILILDDAFSALDTYTEDSILQNLKKIFPDKTVILISHRISTLQNADHIIVLERGKIVEKGSHDALLQQDGLYAHIYQKQLLELEIESVS